MKMIFTKKIVLLAICFFCACADEDAPPLDPPPTETDFYFGADLSYVNQILDKGGLYKVADVTESPYKIFSDKGTDLVRFRLWHNPQWTKEIYGAEGTQLYNDLKDVGKSISLARAHGMKILLDFHYSDTWADPGHQDVPAAWINVASIDVLADSVYNYTLKTLNYLNTRNLLPEFVQIGNEINCGMMITGAPGSFPELNVCESNWVNQGKIINAGIRAVRDVTAGTTIKTKVLLHVADPKNVEWWFDNITGPSAVSDFDIIGFSYYPLWHTTVPISQISDKVILFKSRYNKDVMILETAYPWTTEADDSYNNAFGNEPAIAGYPKTIEGQYDLLVKLTQEVRDGGGIGVVYWEPAWISSELKDLWGTGSSWENCTFFDFDGNSIKGFDYMKFDY